MPRGVFIRTLKPLRARLFGRITIESETNCWPWMGFRGPTGHGQIAIGGYGPEGRRLMPTHKAAWELRNGPVPAGLCVLHKCDNPPCCNPDHLFLGTRADNLADMKQKGRQAVGLMLPHTKLTDHDVEMIRAASDSQRVLAERFGVSQGAISMIRSGQRRAMS